MPQVPGDVRKERAMKLRSAGEKQLTAYLASQVGNMAQVVVEKGRMGRTEHFAMMELDGEYEPGSIVAANVTGADSQKLYGHKIQKEAA
jgi:threonylcarbamoyladenosine tRNA methylthiotransferase MtaB